MRERQFIGGGAVLQLMVDKKLVAYLGSGDYVELDVAPGHHFVAVNFAGTNRVRGFRAERGGRYYFKFYFETGNAEGREPSDVAGVAFFDAVNQDEAGRELREAPYRKLTQ